MTEPNPQPLDTVGANQVPDNLELVPLHRCEEEDYAENCSGKALLAVLLHIRHFSKHTGDTTARSSSISTYGTAASRNAGGQRPRNGTSRNYDRLLFFGDIRSSINQPGRCFVMICQSNLDSQRYLKNVWRNEGIAVGNMFLILEPEPIESNLSNSLAIVQTMEPIVPVTVDHQLLPNIALRPPNPDETLFFVSHNMEIKVHMTHVISGDQVSCKGTLCDRQLEPPPNARSTSCGCLRSHREDGIVLQQMITIPVPREYDPSGTVRIRNLRSWRLMKLLVTQPTNPYMFETNHHQGRKKLLREDMKAVFTYVNTHGGWTIIAWQRQGTVRDSSSWDNNDQVASENQNLHVVYLWPTDVAVVTQPGFRALVHNPMNFDNIQQAQASAAQAAAQNEDPHGQQDDQPQVLPGQVHHD